MELLGGWARARPGLAEAAKPSSEPWLVPICVGKGKHSSGNGCERLKTVLENFSRWFGFS